MKRADDPHPRDQAPRGGGGTGRRPVLASTGSIAGLESPSRSHIARLHPEVGRIRQTSLPHLVWLLAPAPSSATTRSPPRSATVCVSDEGKPDWDLSDVSPDGQRFLMIREDGLADRSEAVVVQNWTEELKRLVPTN